jgi:hypothetical protein
VGVIKVILRVSCVDNAILKLNEIGEEFGLRFFCMFIGRTGVDLCLFPETFINLPPKFSSPLRPKQKLSQPF